ncbi:MAG TPA: OmpA family protein [Dongiaceae bacterium]|jgi:OOP family OmpA-OmpF porin|nr:OmpA family protein [Dongiaceae bacterium]
MSNIKILGALVAVAFLAGCASNIEEARNVQPTAGTPFTRALTKEYKDFALFEADEMKDWPNADYIAVRSLRAASGEVFPAQDPSERNLGDATQEAQQLHARLMGDLNSGGRDRKPEVAARAQARYDCWIEQEEEGWQLDHISACKQELLAALNELEAKEVVAAQEPAKYIVLFDFDKSVITPAGAQVLDQVVANFKAGRSRGVSITGHTDLVGTEEYNLRLSERRADAARAYLVKAGIPADVITTAWRGKTQPVVNTPNREQRNRRDEIILQ